MALPSEVFNVAVFSLLVALLFHSGGPPSGVIPILSGGNAHAAQPAGGVIPILSGG